MCAFDLQELEQLVQIAAVRELRSSELGIAETAHVVADRAKIFGEHTKLRVPHSAIHKTGVNQHQRLALARSFVIQVCAVNTCHSSLYAVHVNLRCLRALSSSVTAVTLE